MLKSLLRQKADEEILPPPPPFPSMGLEEPGQEAVSEDKKETKAKPKKLSKKLKKVKEKSEPKEEFYDLDKDFDFETGPEFKDLEELGIEDLKFEEETNPKEIQQAEDEIASAIEGVKKQGKKSFFSGLFRKKAIQGQQTMPEIEANNLESIKNRINDARNALMNIDLDAAKNCYVDIMKKYNKLKPEEQAQVYHEIRDLYYERKNAEELKV